MPMPPTPTITVLGLYDRMTGVLRSSVADPVVAGRLRQANRGDGGTGKLEKVPPRDRRGRHHAWTRANDAITTSGS
jgi:hypothetical protein